MFVACCYNCNKCRHYSTDCLLPKRMRKEQRSRGFEEKFQRIFSKIMNENNWKSEDFAAEETKEEWFVSQSINVIHSENVKPRENHLLHNLPCLQNRVNILNDKKRNMSFAKFKMKQWNILGVSINRHQKSSTSCQSLRGVLGSDRRQDQQVHGL